MAARRPEDPHWPHPPHAPHADHYTVLGLAAAVGIAEIRRAYRQLALRYHPDRAGPAGTAHFQRIAEAYRVLSDPVERSSYDADRGAGAAVRARENGAAAAYANAGRARPVTVRHDVPGRRPIDRLCGPLDILVARSAAGVRADGVVELYLTTREGRHGGTAVIAVPLRLPCPTCGGVAAPNEVWCVRCDFAGSIVEEISLHIPIPAHVMDGTTFTMADPLGIMPATLRVRIRVATDGA